MGMSSILHIFLYRNVTFCQQKTCKPSDISCCLKLSGHNYEQSYCITFVISLHNICMEDQIYTAQKLINNMHLCYYDKLAQ